MIIIRLCAILSCIVVLPGCKFFWEKEPAPAHATIITFLGAPGSGKGTLAEQAVKELGFVTVSTGNILREAVYKGDALGKQAGTYMKEGKLVPDEMVTDLVATWLSKTIDLGKPIILDGYPRTSRQAELLMQLLKNKFPDATLHVVELVIPDEAIVKRLADRLVCENCSKIYSRSMLQDAQECPACGGALTRRQDDKEEVVRERLKVYEQTISPLRQFYSSSGLEIVQLPVEGKTPQQVFDEFKKKYETLVHADTQKIKESNTTAVQQAHS